jgi:hypothetical protein
MDLRLFDLTVNGIFRKPYKHNYLLGKIKGSLALETRKIKFLDFFEDNYGIGKANSRFKSHKPKDYERNGLLIGNQERLDSFLRWQNKDKKFISCDRCGRPTLSHLHLCSECDEDVKTSVSTKRNAWRLLDNRLR